MSLLAKLFDGNIDAEKTAKDLLNGLFGNKSDAGPMVSTPQTSSANTSDLYTTQSNMPGAPREENQYNYNGTYEQYFEHVFVEDFPAYRFEKSYIDDYGKHRVIYTFYSGEVKDLVVELMTESSEAVKFRNDCVKAGIPYLRFYYDHEGWWNTRSYVVGRIRNILKG